YLLTKGEVSGQIPTIPKPNMIEQTFASQYLLNGTGTLKEFFHHGLVKIASSGVNVSPVTDELGSLLCSFDETFLPGEIICNHIFNGSPLEASFARSAARAARLQELGFIPKGIDILTFIANAIFRGSSEPVILVGLLLQGSIQLKEENEARQVGITRQSLVGQSGSKCLSCLDYRLSLIEEKSENSLLKDRCLELQQKLWETSEKALWDRF